MRLRYDWREILNRAWSIKFIVLAAILSGAEAVVTLSGYRLPLSDFWSAMITFLIVGAAFVARLVAQDGFQ